MLIDQIKIIVKSGDGGEGLLSFDNRQKAWGGDGGNGGDVIIEGDANIYDLSFYNSSKTYKAANGQKGGIHRRAGANGEDLILSVPLVTKVQNDEGDLLASIEHDKESYKIIEGGKGGLGNFSLRSTHSEGKYSRQRPQKGKELSIQLELNLKSDAILLGFPNAGKSSIINALTRSNSRVASYEFTTLEPQLGVMDGYIRLMDLPGLIEGTHKGKGVGQKFLKHTKYSKLLIHCISMECENLPEKYFSMRKEFKKISQHLYDMDEIVVLTKADIFQPAEREKKRAIFELKTKKKVVVVSTYLKDTLLELKKIIKSKLDSLQG